MREILFRGKQFTEDEWIYGYVTNVDGGFSTMIDLENTEDVVHSETIGQYTGLTDKNGNKIFEGDIILSCEYNDIYLVKYFDNENYPAFDCVPYVPFCECNGLSFLVNEEGCEVIGNIHDNPELLKGE